MRYIIDHDYHIHSKLSTCSRHPEQTPERILQYAKDFGLKRIVLTDHYWDRTVPGANKWYAPQDFGWIYQSNPLPQAEGIEFLFGCEGELDMNLTLSIPKENFDEFDFIVIPTTHMHDVGFGISPEDAASPEGRARAWVRRIDAVLDMDLPFHKVGLAHPVCYLLANCKEQEYVATLAAISDSDLVRVFTRAAQAGIGIELNSDDFKRDLIEIPHILRIFRIAKACSCKFYLASDAHTPEQLDIATQRFNRAIDLLGLTEEDKFRF
ncbi:MAG: hypothetical protein IKB34_01755 [Clostridia bacterium]|nr:hypothetical protein [Clostridia bacterium]